MLNETLTYEECERFYTIRDALALFAHRHFNMEGDILPYPDDPTLFDEQVLSDALSRVWADPSAIDAFVSRNPFNLPRPDLAVAQSWKNVLKTHYLVFEHVGKLLFAADNRIFHVLGLVDPLRDVLSYTEPMTAELALLPFNDKIVYDGFAYYLPMHMGPGAKRMINDEIARALDSGEHVVTGGQLAKVAPALKEEWLKRETENMLHDLEMDAKAREQLEGHHEGALVGMTYDEREQAVREHMRATPSLSAISAFDAVGTLKQDCTPGPIERNLRELLMNETKEILRRRCILMGLPHQTKLTKAQLAGQIAGAVGEIDICQTLALQSASPAQFAAYRELFESGGVRHVQAEGLRSLKGLPPVIPMLSYLFFDGAKFTYLIPDEMNVALKGFDWDRTESIVRDFQRSADIADALAMLRGIVTMQEAYDEFARCYPDAFGALDFQTGVYDAVAAGYIGVYVLETPDETYIAHYEVAHQFCEENGIDRDDFGEGVYEGELGVIANILEARKGKVARTLDEDMRSSDAVFERNLRLPAVCALRDYLDAHVPDTEDDYFFADAVIEDLIDYMTFGMVGTQAFQAYWEILQDHGFMPDEAHFHKVLDLLMNMANSMPTWMNNGWAPNELHEAFTGKKTFYNEDGSVKKVGRNDPCPCGSGKKYKKCCGR